MSDELEEELQGIKEVYIFCQIFFMNYPDLKTKIKKEKLYIPKLYGFKIFGMLGSKYYSKDREELFKKMDELGIEHEED